jgi:hypothetical protein
MRAHNGKNCRLGSGGSGSSRKHSYQDLSLAQAFIDVIQKNEEEAKKKKLRKN